MDFRLRRFRSANLIPFVMRDLFLHGESGGRYDDPTLKYQTTAGLTPADDVGENIGLMVTRQPPGDGRGIVNFLLNTATLSTQSVTTAGQDYTLFFSGAGTVALSGTATLAASPAGTYTFTATAGTLTVTVAGSVTSAQINAGTTALPYQENTVSLGGPGINPYQTTGNSRPFVGRVPKSLPGGGGGRRNRHTHTRAIDNAAWTKVRCTATGDSIAGPDGTVTADTITEDGSASTSHFFRQDIAVTSGVTYTRSLYAKANTRSQIAINFGADNSAFAGGEALFTLSGAGSVASTGTLVGTPLIEALSDGWYRCQASATATATATSVNRYMLASGGSTSYNGDGASGLYVTEPQFEASAAATVQQTVGEAYDITETGVPSIPATYYGGDDYLTTGVQEITAAADLFADTGHAWAIGGAYLTIVSGSQTCAAKAGGTLGNRTFQSLQTSAGNFTGNIRGTETTILTAPAAGQWHPWLIWYDGTKAWSMADSNAAIELTVGAAVEEAQNIEFGARTGGAAFMTGFNNIDLLLSRALGAAEAAHFMASQNAYYRGV